MKKKIIPILVAIVLIILIFIIGVVGNVFEKYSYSNERINLKEFFQINGEEVALVLKDEYGVAMVETKGATKNGAYYLPLSFVKEKINDRFYYDYNEGLLIYTTPTGSHISGKEQLLCNKEGEEVSFSAPIQYEEDGQVFVLLDYVAAYGNFSYDIFTEPNRILLSFDFSPITCATIKKDTQARIRGGVKSEILVDLFEGEQVAILEKMDSWTKVLTNTGVIGYIENKRLGETFTREVETVERYIKEEYTSLTKDYKINMVWHMVTNETANGNVMEMLVNTKGVNVISPTWLALSDNEGNISSLSSGDYVNQMHGMGIEVWALVSNFTNEISTKDVISYTSKRNVLIGNLMNQVEQYNLDGINLDFEEIPKEIGEDYIQFIRELSVACRARGVVLSIDNYVPTEYTRHYNRTEQGIVADYVVIMGYDEHWLGSSEPGSVASIDFVENGIKDTVSVVPKEKVINALPFYTILWGSGNETTSVSYSMSKAQELLNNKGITATWDETTCQYYASYEEDGVTYQIWLEENESINTKLNVMSKYEIGGVSGWRLGLEQSSVWDSIVAFQNGTGEDAQN